MARTDIQFNTEIITRQLPQWRSKPRKDNNKVFRLSNLNNTVHVSSSFVQPLSEETNIFLFELCEKYIPNFNPYIKVYPNDVSYFLVKSLMKRFNIPYISHLGIDTYNKDIYIYHSLIHDIYGFDLYPYYQLKRTAPKLFKAFAALINGLGLNNIESGETYFFYDDYEFDCGDMTKKTKEQATKKLEKARKRLKEIKNINVSREETLILLKDFHPKKETLKQVKAFLIKWMHFTPFFRYSFPYEFFDTKKKSNDDDNDKMDVEARIYIEMNQCEIFQKRVKENTQCHYANKEFLNPCWKLNLEEAQEDIQQNIIDFEAFSTDFVNISDLLTKQNKTQC